MKSVWARGLLSEKNITITFQKTLTPSESTKIALTASTVYRLFVAGELFGYGPARAAHGYSRLDEYSLAQWAGRSVTVAVEVYSANINSFYTVDEPPFFAAEITDGGELIAEAPDFTAYRMTERVQRVRKFSFQRTFSEIYHLTGNPAKFYAGDVGERIPVEIESVQMNTLIPRGVNYPTFEVETPAIIEGGSVAVDPTLEPWRDRIYYDIDDKILKGFRPDELEEDSGEEASKFVYKASDMSDGAISGGEYRLYDFSRTLTGFFKLKVSAAADTVLYILFDEIIEENGECRKVDPFRNTCLNIVKYTLAAGEYDLLSFEPNSARFAMVVVTDGEATVDDFGMIKYENPDAPRFTYNFGDDGLNKVTAAAVNTFAQNAVDVLTDCPSRERAGWLCDGYFSGRAEAFLTGKNLVERNFLENYALCPPSPYLPEGMIPMCYPADHNDGTYIPNWSMWYILELKNYCERTGDKALLELSREKVFGLVKFFERFYNEYGLLENLESWVFVEWSKCNEADFILGVSFPTNMLWARTLIVIDEMYGAPELAERGRAMQEQIRVLSWNGEFFEDNARRDSDGNLRGTGNTTETCQYYAFHTGTATRELYPELFCRLVRDFGPLRDDTKVYPTVYRSNAFIGNYLRLEVMLECGLFDQVLKECKDFFLQMATLTGTLWEHATVGCSMNHGFASIAAMYIDACTKRLWRKTN